MERFKKHEEVCRAMAEPAFYPHPVSSLKRIDTHISTVFLTGEWVYKLKKPVDFGFLNFSDLDSRRYYCEREVHLNQRLSHGVYVGVVRICRSQAGRFSLDEAGETVEYAVKMRQLSEEYCLEAILSQSQSQSQSEDLLRAGMEKLGHYLAAFYGRSERSAEVDHFGDPEVISFNMEENFRQIEPFVDELIPREEWEFIREVSRAFFHNWSGLFEKRVQAGRICDGHGDLRAAHIYFLDGIQIIDCIEFNDRFRYGDVIADLAFLHMDMDHRGHSNLSLAMLAAYVEHADDFQLYTLLDFYAAYRAIVKLKVTCLRSTEVDGIEVKEELQREAESYMQNAYRYAVQFSRPTLWVFCGLPASGKSLNAEKLSEALSLALYQSDRIRKDESRFPAVSSETVVPYNEGIYRTELRNRVYGQMLAFAQEQMRNGHSVVLDASFSRHKWRDEAKRLSVDMDTDLIFVECVAGEESIRLRLKQREDNSGISDARLQHLPRFVANFEPIKELEPENYLKLDTDRPINQAFGELVSEGYALKSAQIKKVLNR
ncbi:MAG: AAA family ATPase [Syntrophobacteraceae bacterium]